MDGTKANAKVRRGYAIAAAKLGTAHAHYRPLDGAPALSDGNLLGDVRAVFDTNAYKFTLPQNWSKPVWTGLWNPEATQVGDYLVDGERTFFIASQHPLLPMQAVLCNAVVSLHRLENLGPTEGFQRGYAGAVREREVPILTDWPCGLYHGIRGERSATNLPSEAGGSRGFDAYLPLLPEGLEPRAHDILRQGEKRMVVASAERTDMGWRLILLHYAN